MNKKPEKNKSHSQDETQLSPEEIRMFRHFLNGYMMGIENSQKETKPSSKKTNYPKLFFGIALGLLISNLIVKRFLF